jgi:hypothetical protein
LRKARWIVPAEHSSASPYAIDTMGRAPIRLRSEWERVGIADFLQLRALGDTKMAR